MMARPYSTRRPSVLAQADRIEAALHNGVLALAGELRTAGIADAVAWRAADRAIEAAASQLEREVRL
jgi:hypothetical protein